MSVLDMLRGVGSALTHANLTLVAVALALHVSGLVVTGERWRVVIAGLGSRLSLYRTTLINLAGIFVRNATPTTGLGGDASRIALLRAHGVPLAQATASFAYVRLAELPPLALVVLLSTPAVARVVSRSTTAAGVSPPSRVAIAAAVAVWQRARLRRHVAALWMRNRTSASRSRIVRPGGRLRDARAGRDDRAANRGRRGARCAVDDPAVRNNHGDDDRRRIRADGRQHRGH